jgi:resuscitation-promoting factor RpfA
VPEPVPEPAVAAENGTEATIAEPEAIEAVVDEAFIGAAVELTDEPPAGVMAEPEAEEAAETPADLVVEAASEAFPAEEAEQAAAEVSEAEVAPDATVETAPAAVADTVDDQVSDDTGEAAPPTVEPAAAAAAAYAVDDSVLAILREEAEREANARRAEALESQTELGIDAAAPRKSQPKAVEAEAKPAARRDLLPDVEEINSTLRPSEGAIGADGTPDFVAPPPQAPHGFRSGFLTLMTVAILAAALYIVAPRLGTIVPALAGPLETYVSMIDGLRLGLDGMMRSATVAINGG